MRALRFQLVQLLTEHVQRSCITQKTLHVRQLLEFSRIKARLFCKHIALENGHNVSYNLVDYVFHTNTYVSILLHMLFPGSQCSHRSADRTRGPNELLAGWPRGLRTKPSWHAWTAVDSQIMWIYRNRPQAWQVGPSLPHAPGARMT